MSIFNTDKTKIKSDQNISLEDYERRISERTEEYRRLNKILRGMRAEVSNLMDEIKHLSDEVVKKNAEVFLADQKLDDLNHDYHLLKQNIGDEQEIYLNLVRKTEQFKEEFKSDLQIQDKFNLLKDEYNSVLTQISEKKSELDSIKKLTNIPVVKAVVTNEITVDKHKIKKNVKRCSAKTKNGVRCKRAVMDNSRFCKIHVKQSDR